MNNFHFGSSEQVLEYVCGGGVLFVAFALAQEVVLPQQAPVYLLANVACFDTNSPAEWYAFVDCLTPWIALQAYTQRKVVPEFKNSSPVLDPTLKVVNNGGQPGEGLTITATNQLVPDPKPNIMLGNSWSSVTMASNSFMSNMKELQLGYSSTNAKLSNKAQYPYFMRVIAPDSVQSRVIAKVLLELQYTQVTCLYTDDAYANDLALDFRTFALEDGISVAMHPLPYGLYTAWPDRMASALAEGNRVYVVAAAMGEVPPLWREMLKAGIAKKENLVFGAETLAFKHIGPETVGHIGVMPVSKGALWPEFLEFWKTFRLSDLPADIREKADACGYTDDNFKAGDMPAGFYVPFQADNMFAALLAMEGVAKKGLPSDQIRSDALKDEMYKLVFQGVTGPVAFDQNGDRLGDYEIYNHVKVGGEIKMDIVGLWGTSGVKFDKQPTFPLISVRRQTPPGTRTTISRMAICLPDFTCLSKLTACSPRF